MPKHGRDRRIGRPFKKGEGGRPPGTKNKKPAFLNDLFAIYEEKGGRKYLKAWIEKSALNERRYIETILMAALKEIAELHEHSADVRLVISNEFLPEQK